MEIIWFYGALALWVAYTAYCIWTCEREKLTYKKARQLEKDLKEVFVEYWGD